MLVGHRLALVGGELWWPTWPPGTRAPMAREASTEVREVGPSPRTFGGREVGVDDLPYELGEQQVEVPREGTEVEVAASPGGAMRVEELSPHGGVRPSGEVELSEQAVTPLAEGRIRRHRCLRWDGLLAVPYRNRRLVPTFCSTT